MYGILIRHPRSHSLSILLYAGCRSQYLSPIYTYNIYPITICNLKLKRRKRHGNEQARDGDDHKSEKRWRGGLYQDRDREGGEVRTGRRVQQTKTSKFNSGEEEVSEDNDV